jgi:hypothetical protein
VADDSAVTERWLPVVGFEGFYEVSDLGRVRSITRSVLGRDGRRQRWVGRIRTPQCHKKHLNVALYKSGQAYRYEIQRLVLLTFVGDCPEGMEACHNNGNPLDNRLTNLRWDTHANNGDDLSRHGTHPYRQKTHCPRGHRLESPNLVKYTASRGYRGCLACSRARAATHRAAKQGRLLDLDAIADQRYKVIMG